MLHEHPNLMVLHLYGPQITRHNRPVWLARFFLRACNKLGTAARFLGVRKAG